jgi:16S rRNA (guanine(1405)-N(7))-methyltransferase
MPKTEEINLILQIIKKSKKYNSISEELLKKEIQKYFKLNPKDINLLEKPKSKKFKEIIKAIKSKIHLAYGSFQTKDKGKREEYLKNIQGINDYKNHDLILSTSVSSKERLNDYKTLYRKIFKITGKPKKIIDLGCGLNPISYPYIGITDLIYKAYDIDREDCDFLNKYFSLMKDYTKLKGTATMQDLSSIEEINKVPRADVCLMFKFLDVIESKGHKLSEQIIKTLNCKYIISSFPTKTVSGNKMKHPYRGWIEKMLERIDYKFEKITTDNEIFYIIEKQ